ncbi:MAG: DegT/DnrJ/EryC1/StrS family aminotransferase, partial [archaeon]|nr:DegT/DnrJ/EryC1/StrS family aminotransferase [archaeon]
MTNIQADIEGITLPVEKEWAKNVYWMYSILIENEFGMNRDELMWELEKKGIETRTFFIPIEGLHPLYPCVQLTDRLIYVSKANVRCKVDVAEELAEKGMYLPSSSGLT